MLSLRRNRKRRWTFLLSPWIALVLLMLNGLTNASDFSQDDRCYLSNGGSSETFTVKEDLPIGSVVGTLPIPGDPSELGDIELTLRVSENDEETPISIQPGTKNLILRRQLDKEGVVGPSSLVLDVACSRRDEVDDQSITIPVRIIVTDANDNAPSFVGAPYSVNISEVTLVGSTVLQGIKAVDRDQYGPYSTVEYHIIPGPYSYLLSFENTLEGHLVLNETLDYETLRNFTIGIRAQDQGTPPQSSDTTISVYVQDADDQNPKFQHERYVSVLPERQRPGTELITQPANVKAEDPDEGIRASIVYTFNSNSSGEYSYFNLDRRTGRVTIAKALPEEIRLPFTLVLKATQTDNVDRYSLTTLTVDSDVPQLATELKFLQSEYVTTVLESAPVGQVVSTVYTTKPNDKRVRLQLQENTGQKFAIRNSGEVFVAKPLDYEEKTTYSLRIVVSDGKTSNVARLNVTVMNVNDHDPRFAQPQYNFVVKQEEVRIGSHVGTVQVVDGDVDDSIELNVKGPFARVFSISNKGEVRIRSLEFLNASTCHVIVVATDTGVPPRQSSVPVTVQFPEDIAQSSVYRVKKSDSSLVLMIVFGSLLGTLLIVIVTLTIYILKTKQYRDRIPTTVNPRNAAGNKMVNYITSNGNHSGKPNGHVGNGSSAGNRAGVENPVFNMADSNHRDTRNPVPPPAPAEVTAWKMPNGSGSLARVHPQENDREETRIIVQNGNTLPLPNGKIQNIYWPNGSIPRRVKKLSWEDERQNKIDHEPDVSATPLFKTTTDSSKPPGLTVYF